MVKITPKTEAMILDDEIVEAGAAIKNHIDDDGRIRIPQDLTPALKDGMAIQPFNVWNDESKLRIKKIHESEIIGSRITPEEYKAFKEKYKSPSRVIPRALLGNIIFEILALAFLAAGIGIFIFNRELAIYGALGIAFTMSLALVGFMLSYSKVKSEFVSPTTHVARGKVMQFRRVRNNSDQGDLYISQVDVVFFSNNTYVTKIFCSQDAYKQLNPGSDVLIVDGNLFYMNEKGEYQV